MKTEDFLDEINIFKLGGAKTPSLPKPQPSPKPQPVASPKIKTFLVVAGILAAILFATDASSRQHVAKVRFSDKEYNAMVAREYGIRDAAARHLYGDGNPEHIRALADELDPEYLKLYKRAISN